MSADKSAAGEFGSREVLDNIMKWGREAFQFGEDPSRRDRPGLTNWGRIRNRFLQGVTLVVPLALLVAFGKWLLSTVTGWLPSSIVEWLSNSFLGRIPAFLIEPISGLFFILIAVIVLLLVGIAVHNLGAARLAVRAFDAALGKVPLYDKLKGLVEQLAGEGGPKIKFDRVVSVAWNNMGLSVLMMVIKEFDVVVDKEGNVRELTEEERESGDVETERVLVLANPSAPFPVSGFIFLIFEKHVVDTVYSPADYIGAIGTFGLSLSNPPGRIPWPVDLSDLRIGPGDKGQ